MKKVVTVIALVSDGKHTFSAEVDALLQDDGPGATLVWKWGRKDDDSEEVPIAFTKLPTANLKKISEGRYVSEGAPVYWENLEEIGLVPPPPEP